MGRSRLAEERNCSKEPKLEVSFQLIILLEQFRLLESNEERSIYIKISPSPSHQASSLDVDTICLNWGDRETA